MLTLTPDVVRTLQDHARACYPAESVALLFASAGSQRAERVAVLDNIADRLHAMDPDEYPRTSRDFFAVNEAKMLRQVREHEAQGLSWIAFVHSHIDCGAYFSAEDKKYAAPDGQPPYPHLHQVVIETHADRIGAARAFRWDGRDFTETQTFSEFARTG